jgi:hypothetical protein
VWVAEMVLPPAVKALDGHFTTSHGDSLLFGCAVTIIISCCVEEPRLRRHRLFVLILPIIIAGMIVNNRRLVWVELSSVTAVLCAIGPRWIKRAVAKLALLAIVPAAGYVALGWNSSSSVFLPVSALRSIQDGNVDASTLFRDIENYNLLYTLRSHPLAGTGFGHPFTEIVKNFDISFFKEYYFLPHNSVLGLWAYCGPIGFSGLSLVLVVGAFLAVRSYRFAQCSEHRVAAFTAFAMLLMYEIQCWGDIGFSEKKSIFLVGPALAIAGQLAMSTGAWKSRQRATARARV